MDIRIKDLNHMVQRAWITEKWDKVERYENRIDKILERVYNDLLSEVIDCFYKKTETKLIVLHRNPKKDGYLQLSGADFENGELIPAWDSQIGSLKDLLREGIESGMWHTKKNGGIYGQNRNEEHALPS